MSEWFTVGLAKDSAKNFGRAGHDVAEVGGAFLDELRAIKMLASGDAHDAAKKSWEGLGRGISGVVGTVARTGLATLEIAGATAVAPIETTFRAPGIAARAVGDAVDNAIEKKAREIVQEEMGELAAERRPVATITRETAPATREAAPATREAAQAQPEAVTAESTDSAAHVVKKGESLWKIAEEAYRASHDGQVDHKAVLAQTEALKSRYGEVIYPGMTITM